jgi:hypothetical protein
MVVANMAAVLNLDREIETILAFFLLPQKKVYGFLLTDRKKRGNIRKSVYGWCRIMFGCPKRGHVWEI